MLQQQRKRGFSFYLLSSFFGAAMIAGSYAYFNWKFSEYRFINFSKVTYYTSDSTFEPKNEEYLVVVYSSNRTKKEKIRESIKNDNIEILAIDLAQRRYKSENNVTYLSAGINTLLGFVQTFNVYYAPSGFFIKREKNNKTLYKQNSMVQSLDI
jgi:hypothetical protein